MRIRAGCEVRKMQILIVSDQPDQADADFLTQLLLSRGIAVRQLKLADLAEHSSYSLNLNPAAPASLSWQRDVVNLNEIDLVLCLSASRPAYAGMVELEEYAAESERGAHRAALLAGLRASLLALGITWHNYGAQPGAAERVGQYLAAQQLGLAFPASLCSNDAQQIRSFIQAQGGRVLALALTDFATQISALTDGARGYILSLSQCDFDAALFASPALYQQLIPLACSVKVVVSAHTAYAWLLRDADNLQLHSQTAAEFSATPISYTAEQCQLWQAWLKMSGLQLATLDFVLDAQQNWWFIGLSERLHLRSLQQAQPQSAMMHELCESLIHDLLLSQQANKKNPVLQ